MDFKLFLESSIIKPYVLPNNKEELFYDFYMCNLLLPPSGRKETPKNVEPTAKKSPIPLDVKQKSITSESYSHIEEEAQTELKRAFELIVKKIKEDLLKALFFGIVCETRHSLKLPSKLKQYEKALQIKDDNPFLDLLNSEIKNKNDIDRTNFFKVILLLMDSRNLSDEDIVKISLFNFNNKDNWEEGYGGIPWAKISEAYLDLKKATTTNEIAIQIDHVFDLQHNTGIAINKSQLWTKHQEFRESDFYYDGFSWLTFALDTKANIKSPHELILFISKSLKSIVLPLLKSRYRFGLDSPQAKKLMLGKDSDKVEQIENSKIKDVVSKLIIHINNTNKLVSARSDYLQSNQLINLIIGNLNGELNNLHIETKINKKILFNLLRGLQAGNIIDHLTSYDSINNSFIYQSIRFVFKYYPQKQKVEIEDQTHQSSTQNISGPLGGKTEYHFEEEVLRLYEEIQNEISLKEFLKLLVRLQITNELTVRGIITQAKKTKSVKKLVSIRNKEFALVDIDWADQILTLTDGQKKYTLPVVEIFKLLFMDWMKKTTDKSVYGELNVYPNTNPDLQDKLNSAFLIELLHDTFQKNQKQTNFINVLNKFFRFVYKSIFDKNYPLENFFNHTIMTRFEQFQSRLLDFEHVPLKTATYEIRKTDVAPLTLGSGIIFNGNILYPHNSVLIESSLGLFMFDGFLKLNLVLSDNKQEFIEKTKSLYSFSQKFVGMEFTTPIDWITTRVAEDIWNAIQLKKNKHIVLPGQTAAISSTNQIIKKLPKDEKTDEN